MNCLPQRRRENLTFPYPPLKLRVVAKGCCSASQRLHGGFIIVILFFLFVPFLSNAAEIYRWTDDEGVVHVTDDRSVIPDKYWEEERVEKEEIKPSPEEAPSVNRETAPKAAGTGRDSEGREIYGDHPLDWWIYKFKESRKRIAESQERIDEEKNFITVFEGGRRYGKIYTKEEIEQYESYKADIPVAEEKLKTLKEQLEDLQRKARINGVPRKAIE